MSIELKTVAAGIIAIGLAASGAYAEEGQTKPPQGSQKDSGMQQRGMMGMPGGMMGQMSQMMEHCNQMMSEHMQPPNSQFPKPEQPPKS